MFPSFFLCSISILPDQFLRDLAVIIHNLRMIVPYQLCLKHGTCCPVYRIFIDFGYPVIFIPFFMKMVILFRQLIAERKFSLAAEFAVQPLIFAPYQKLDILISIILKR